MRELQYNEIDSVSGGDITWFGPRGSSFENNYSPASWGWNSYTAAAGLYPSNFSDLLNQLSSTALVDTDGDGVLDSPEIVVTAPVTARQAQIDYNAAVGFVNAYIDLGTILAAGLLKYPWAASGTAGATGLAANHKDEWIDSQQNYYDNNGGPPSMQDMYVQIN